MISEATPVCSRRPAFSDGLKALHGAVVCGSGLFGRCWD